MQAIFVPKVSANAAVRPSPLRRVQVSAGASAPSAQKTEYYSVVANADFFFNDVQNEPFAEQLREKVRFLNEKNMERDFWLVPEPAWLDNYPAEAKKVKRPAVALVSSNKLWIAFMKLRLDRVLRIDLGQLTQEEATKSAGSLPSFTPPQKWTAPYGRYAYGWWEPFLPGNEKMDVGNINP